MGNSGLTSLMDDLKRIIKDPSVRERVERRMREFDKIRESDCNRIFSELAFCLLTANYSAHGGIRIQEAIGEEGFLSLSMEELAIELRRLGHRFPNARATYIVEARQKLDTICRKIKHTSDKEAFLLREWLVKNIRGLGYKEASHFLRNTGFRSVAIIDYHILDLLARYGIIVKPKHMNKNTYLRIERVLQRISENLGIPLGELDLYLWYMETGRILK